MSGRRGLTLVEAVVALGTAAVLLTAVAGTVSRAARIRALATHRAERVATARTVLLRMADELRAALPGTGPASAERLVAARVPPDAPSTALRFATGADDARLVAYRVEDRVLVRRAASRFAPPVADPPAVPLVDGVAAFRVRAFDGHRWTPGWTRGDLPRALSLSLVLDDGETLATTVVPALGDAG